MSLCGIWFLPSTLDDIALIEGVMVAESLELMEVVCNFCQFQLALYVGFGVEMGLGLGIVQVGLLVAVDHLIVGDSEVVNVSSDTPIVEVSSFLLDKGISGRGPSE
jgi:hypothetical protein